jgi:hypothetical protein
MPITGHQNRPSSLPQQIPQQSAAFGEMELDQQTGKPTGKVIIDINWYLFLYNLAKQTLSGPGVSPIPITPADSIALTDVEIASADQVASRRQIENLNALVQTLLDAGADRGPPGAQGPAGAQGPQGNPGSPYSFAQLIRPPIWMSAQHKFQMRLAAARSRNTF